MIVANPNSAIRVSNWNCKTKSDYQQFSTEILRDNKLVLFSLRFSLSYLY